MAKQRSSGGVAPGQINTRQKNTCIRDVTNRRNQALPVPTLRTTQVSMRNSHPSEVDRASGVRIQGLQLIL